MKRGRGEGSMTHMASRRQTRPLGVHGAGFALYYYCSSDMKSNAWYRVAESMGVLDGGRGPLACMAGRLKAKLDLFTIQQHSTAPWPGQSHLLDCVRPHEGLLALLGCRCTSSGVLAGAGPIRRTGDGRAALGVNTADTVF